MEKIKNHVIGKNQFMKKSIFVVAAVFITSATIAQQKKEKQPPPPPPPPVAEVKQAPPPPPPPPTVQGEKFSLPDNADYKAFLKRNPTVKEIGWMQNKTVRIRLKSGKEEMYDLNNEEDALKLKNKYGELPPTPPPPPPPPPKVRKISQA